MITFAAGLAASLQPKPRKNMNSTNYQFPNGINKMLFVHRCRPTPAADYLDPTGLAHATQLHREVFDACGRKFRIVMSSRSPAAEATAKIIAERAPTVSTELDYPAGEWHNLNRMRSRLGIKPLRDYLSHEHASSLQEWIGLSCATITEHIRKIMAEQITTDPINVLICGEPVLINAIMWGLFSPLNDNADYATLIDQVRNIILHEGQAFFVDFSGTHIECELIESVIRH